MSPDERELELRGLRILLTRPEEQAQESAELIEAAGGVPLLHPCLRLAPPEEPAQLESALRQLEQYTWVALASATAARLCAPALLACAHRPRLATVGPRTAAALTERGLRVALCTSESATAEGLRDALLATMRTEGREPRHERVLLPRAAEGRQVLADDLAAAGVVVTAVTAYRMLPAAAEELAPLRELLFEGGVDLVPFGSPRSADIVLTVLGETAPQLLRRFAVGAMGATTAAALRARAVQVDATATSPATFASLLAALAAVHRERHP